MKTATLMFIEVYLNKNDLFYICIFKEEILTEIGYTSRWKKEKNVSI
jgi:hypothetical protein